MHFLMRAYKVAVRDGCCWRSDLPKRCDTAREGNSERKLAWIGSPVDFQREFRKQIPRDYLSIVSEGFLYMLLHPPNCVRIECDGWMLLARTCFSTS